ncbi:MAG TPA: hypothetical protein VD884_23380 [Ohtaekwangia sp.]|nr:hypothetical protein [Ohtaekwangia sp.]
MKTKNIVLLAISALMTLSFTFVSVNSSKTEKSSPKSEVAQSEPLGGFALEDKL